ncbi:hypothetical protein SAMD00019534_064260 [Acytostelium subglobosum LB1]|uniref:hypothetical protein n=1 Tax=Acytostelium subglobosum LB1 TaxID=1410327 RepID=UPI0006450CE8|nr:hypothetical protein SAMD00019534_064260 [Acytostelium subglobosum LB1]GAM23251.1 hypothetical protein SAMD00019534_064260 [Acytostelium subglobosum LB1]|eukprot:XP_012753700.1 hypothetical protein SAMD00019534_064260 [Acytostelium subglobosum LB1]
MDTVRIKDQRVLNDLRSAQSYATNHNNNPHSSSSSRCCDLDDEDQMHNLTMELNKSGQAIGGSAFNLPYSISTTSNLPKFTVWGKLENSKYCIDLTMTRTILGRGDAADFKFPSEALVSSKHCSITLGLAQQHDTTLAPELLAFITDHSTNGTLLSRQPIERRQPTLLRDGAEISLQSDRTTTTFVFRSLLQTLSVQDKLEIIDNLEQQQSIDADDIVTDLSQSASSITYSGVDGCAMDSIPCQSGSRPESFIQLLKVQPTLANIRLLATEVRLQFMGLPLTANPTGPSPSLNKNDQYSWINQFIHLGGISALLDVVSVNNKNASKSSESKMDIDIECINTLKILINFNIGMKAILSEPNSTFSDMFLVLLNPKHTPTLKTALFSMCSNICLVSEQGHNYVLQAMERIQILRRDKHRFKWLMESLVEETDITYKVSCMSFINSTLQGAINDSVKESLKQEFLQIPFQRLFELLHQENSPKLNDQLNTFSQHFGKSHDLWFKSINLNDPVSLCIAVHNQLKEEKLDDSLTSILRELFTISFPDNAAVSSNSNGSSPNGASQPVAVDRSEMLKVLAQFTKSLSSMHLNATDPVNYDKSMSRLRRTITSLQEESINSSPKPTTSSMSSQENSFCSSPSFSPSPPPPPPPPMAPPPPPPPGTDAKGANKEKLPSNVQMKQLFWSKIPSSKVKKTVWDKCDEAKHIDFSKSKLDELFSCKKMISKNGSQLNMKEEKISIVDIRRSNNIGILISKYKITSNWIVDTMLSMDEKQLSKEIVLVLVKCVPTSEEEGLLKNYQGNKNMISPVDQFLLETLKVPKIRERLNCLQFKQQYDSVIDDVMIGSKYIETTSLALLKCSPLRQLLHLILKIGNYLNTGTNRGNADGYKLSCLLTLSTTKSFNNKTTLLHHIAQIISDKHPNLLITSESIPSLEPASRVQWKELLGHIESLKQGMASVQNEVESQLVQYGVDPFTSKMKNFIIAKQTQLEDVVKYTKKVEESFDNLMKYYLEEYQAPEEFFSLLNNFFTNLNKAHRDNQRETAMANKSAMTKTIRRHPTVNTSKNKKSVADKPNGGENESKFNLFSKIKNKDKPVSKSSNDLKNFKSELKDKVHMADLRSSAPPGSLGKARKDPVSAPLKDLKKLSDLSASPTNSFKFKQQLSQTPFEVEDLQAPSDQGSNIKNIKERLFRQSGGLEFPLPTIEVVKPSAPASTTPSSAPTTIKVSRQQSRSKLSATIKQKNTPSPNSTTRLAPPSPISKTPSASSLFEQVKPPSPWTQNRLKNRGGHKNTNLPHIKSIEDKKSFWTNNSYPNVQMSNTSYNHSVNTSTTTDISTCQRRKTPSEQFNSSPVPVTPLPDMLPEFNRMSSNPTARPSISVPSLVSPTRVNQQGTRSVPQIPQLKKSITSPTFGEPEARPYERSMSSQVNSFEPLDAPRSSNGRPTKALTKEKAKKLLKNIKNIFTLKRTPQSKKEHANEPEPMATTLVIAQ